MVSLSQRGLKICGLPVLITVIFVGGFGVSSGLKVNPAFADENIKTQLITFSPESLVSRQPVQLSLNSSIEGTIRYTTNGGLPSVSSTPYTGTLTIKEPTTIRAQLFNHEGIPIGDLQTKSYIIADYERTIPVVSIVADWADLNLLHTYSQERGRDWERPINLEYFARGGQIQFNVKAGLRIHGGKSRQVSQKKSYRIYFRQSYGGPGNLEYPLFPDSPVAKFDKLVLRAGFNDSFTYVNSGGFPTNETYTAKYIGDQVVRNLHRDMGQPIAHGIWVLLYLNGEFWGLYNLTERIDLQFLRSYSDKDSDWDIIKKEVGVDTEGNWYNVETVVDGDHGAWLENQNWVGSADFSNPGNIGVLEWRVDMENVFSYMFLQAYVQNYDWPGNNWVAYRRKDPGATGNEGRWRLTVWDAEYNFGGGSEGFKTDINTLSRVYSPHDSITRILEKPFISDCYLKHRFVQRAREYLGVENLKDRPENEVGQLSKERVKAEILQQANIVRPFIEMEVERWAPNLSVDSWEKNIENMMRFVDKREEVILHHLDLLRYQTFTGCK